MSLDLKLSELKHSFLKDRLTSVGKHFDEIRSKLSSYICKLASVTDSGDEVAQSISNFASKEMYNRTMKLALGEFSDILFSIERYREAQMQRTQVKVIQELESYNPLCKQTKVELKKCFDAEMKELKKKNELEKARSKNPPNWQKIAEKEASLAEEDTQRLMQEMEKNVESFERKKLKDLKQIFLEFIKIQMIFHAKAIEQYSKAFNVIQEIQVDDDFQEFSSFYKARTCLKAPALSLARQSIESTADDVTAKSPPHKTHAVPPNAQRRQRSVFTMKTSSPDAANTSTNPQSASDSKFVSIDLN